MIESRYTIEYINPDSTNEPKTRKRFILFALSGLTVIAILVYAYLSINQLNDFVRVPTKPQEQKLRVVDDTKENKEVPTSIYHLSEVDGKTKTTSNAPIKTIRKGLDKPLLEKNQQASKQTKQLEINKKLNQSINDLTKQLMAEREKNKTLDKQLNSQKNTNNQLSNLLENTLLKASTADKKYLDALNNTLKTSKKNNNNNNVTEKMDKPVELDIQIVAQNIKPTEKINSINAVSLSTNSQVDAIIAAMQGTISKTIIKTSIDKSNEVQLASVNKKNPTELLHIQLQRQIDQLLFTKNTIKSTSPKINTEYKIALEKESNIRKNAVRSITIKKGETLWSIAQRAYGNGILYKKIIEANPQSNLKQLFVGQVIRVPK